MGDNVKTSGDGWRILGGTLVLVGLFLVVALLLDRGLAAVVSLVLRGNF